jgi:hypothetical protein
VEDEHTVSIGVLCQYTKTLVAGTFPTSLRFQEHTVELLVCSGQLTGFFGTVVETGTLTMQRQRFHLAAFILDP